MSGHTHIHTHIHTYTHDNYYNPRCAHVHRGLITTAQGFRTFSFQFNVAYYIELLKTVYVKRCVQAKAKTSRAKEDKTVFSLICGYYYQLNGNTVLRIRVYIHARWSG